MKKALRGQGFFFFLKKKPLIYSFCSIFITGMRGFTLWSVETKAYEKRGEKRYVDRLSGSLFCEITKGLVVTS